MNMRRTTALALLSGLGLATLIAGSLVSNTALAVGRHCTVSSSTSSTGREWGLISPSRQNPTICIRQRMGGEAPPGFPSCHEVGKYDLGCVVIVDAP